jgi:alkane 1-monooxygenase
MVDKNNQTRLPRALSFWTSLVLLPLAWVAAVHGGWTILLVPLSTWLLFSVLDHIVGLDVGNPDPHLTDAAVLRHRLVTLAWPPLQFLTIFGVIGYMVRSGHLSTFEMFAVAFGIGVFSGTIGIVYAHELMHQKSRLERWLADLLMTMALYGHFRSEHLLVHHRYVGTPKDPVTARYNESFHAFFPRVVWQSLVSSWNAEKAMLARKELPAWDRSNPFWRYLSLDLCWLFLALIVGGWTGVLLFVFQAFVAIWQLELVNYVEHYGLTRKHLGAGKYEPSKPHHSWNAAQLASNRLLINLQRHSDHHTNPQRRFPLLQTYSADEAPQLPYGYPVMTTMALIPPLWRRKMNPRVRQWRERFYPEISDWRPYNRATNPPPK